MPRKVINLQIDGDGVGGVRQCDVPIYFHVGIRGHLYVLEQDLKKCYQIEQSI